MFFLTPFPPSLLFLMASIEIFQIIICMTFFSLGTNVFSLYFCAEINTVLFLSFLICTLTIDDVLLRIVSVAPILGTVSKACSHSWEEWVIFCRGPSYHLRLQSHISTSGKTPGTACVRATPGPWCCSGMGERRQVCVCLWAMRVRSWSARTELLVIISAFMYVAKSFLLAVIHRSFYISRCNYDADGNQIRERDVRWHRNTEHQALGSPAALCPRGRRHLSLLSLQ